MKASLLLVYSLSLAPLMIVGCSNPGTGFTGLQPNCTGTGCNNSTNSVSSIYISTQNATMAKAISVIGPCVGPVSATGMCQNGAYQCTDVGCTAGSVIFKQQLQLSGLCNPAGAAFNSITFTIKRSGTNFPNDIYGNAYSSFSTKCDNGRFMILVTPPQDSAQPNNPTVFNNSSYQTPYQVVVSLNTGTTATALTPTSQYQSNFFVAF